MLYLVNPRRVWSSTRTRMYERPEAGARDLITDMVPENEIAAFVISEPVSPMTAVQHVGHFRAQGVAALATQGRLSVASSYVEEEDGSKPSTGQRTCRLVVRWRSRVVF